MRTIHHNASTGPTTDKRDCNDCEAPMTRDQKDAIMTSALSDAERALIDAYWRAANYLSSVRFTSTTILSSSNHSQRITSSRDFSGIGERRPV